MHDLEYYQNLKFYLITMGPTKEHLYTGGGHSMLRLYNANNQKDIVYNWGTFEPNTEGFALKLLQSTLPYNLGVYYTDKYFENEKKREGAREIIEDEFLLTHEQKKDFYNLLIAKEKTDRSGYQYHIWNNNCSTKIRDLLLEVYGPSFKDSFQKKSSLTYRDLWNQTFAKYYYEPKILNIFLNSKTDQVINEWDTFYVPYYLRKGVIDYHVVLNTEVKALDPKLSPKTFEFYQGYLLFFVLFFGVPFFRKQALKAYLLIHSLIFLLMLFFSFFTQREYMFLPMAGICSFPLFYKSKMGAFVHVLIMAAWFRLI